MQRKLQQNVELGSEIVNPQSVHSVIINHEAQFQNGQMLHCLLCNIVLCRSCMEDLQKRWKQCWTDEQLITSFAISLFSRPMSENTPSIEIIKCSYRWFYHCIYKNIMVLFELVQYFCLVGNLNYIV